MRVAIIDPFYDDSHRQWTQGLVKYSLHEYVLITQSPHHWKWRMAAGALYSADQVNQQDRFDLILATDMVNVPLLKSQLNSKHISTPIALYFHENQITYPWSQGDPDIAHKRDHHYGWINYTSALTADKIFFNSKYHYDSLTQSLVPFLSKFPQSTPLDLIQAIIDKSSVVPLGMDFGPDSIKAESEIPTILWNHRWEEDKKPDLFFNALRELKKQSIDFQLIVCGKSLNNSPSIFRTVEIEFRKELIHFGYAATRDEYLALLTLSDILLVTSNQDFFGISVVEAIYHGCYPILPNRLAYPEHIPPSLQVHHLYDDHTEMMNLLTNVIASKEKYEATDLQEYVKRYEWSRVIEDYDNVLIHSAMSKNESV